jgi:hypothetical protein
MKPFTLQDIDLRVLYKPEIEVEEVFIHTKAGNEVELVCTVHAVPHATVHWTKNGQPLATASDRMRTDSHHSRLTENLGDHIYQQCS